MAWLIVEYILVALTILSVLGGLLILAYLRLTERLAPNFSDSFRSVEKKVPTPPFLSIIITAKNEESTIGNGIRSLLAQTHRDFELIIVDDSSTDGTQQVVKELQKHDSRIHLVSAGEKPAGWIGKSWPCQRGFEECKGEVILFADADSVFEPQAVWKTLGYFQAQSYDMFSISPKVRLRGIWSNAIMPLLSGGINLLYPMKKVNDTSNARAYVFGTFIMVRRSVYEAIGGHKAVRERLVEDAAIASLAKSKGYKLRVEKGGGVLTTEWESDLQSVYHGLERVFSDSIRPYGSIAMLNAILIFFLGIYPLLVAVSCAYLYFSGSPSVPIAISGFFGFLGVAGFLVLYVSELRLTSGVVGAYPLIYPLGCLIFMAAIVSASRKISQGLGFEWKGQRYPSS